MEGKLMNETAKQLKNGLWYQNPTLVLLLGMCPTLATSTSVVNALGMGLSATAVLICSNFIISLLRKVIPDQIRIASYVVVIAGVVSAIDMLLQAFLPDVSNSLGIFIPLIVVNCIIFARAESFAAKNTPLRSAVDGLAMGLGFTMSLTVVSTIREILGNGSILGVDLTFGVFQPAMLMIMPVGGFLTLGMVIAAMQRIMRRGKKGEDKN
ncbi:MAG: electron transport complex subunit E [Oscillospiraceae bacterium]|jgi:electron transport complex protein RnfE|nr:electron transport complex subunit E [Oscillospiraceae bacterium]